MNPSRPLSTRRPTNRAAGRIGACAVWTRVFAPCVGDTPWWRFVAIALVTWAIALAPARAEPAPLAYQVIVNVKNPQTTVDRELATQTFFKKVVIWPHGGVIKPVDLPMDSPVRRQFSQEVLGRSISAVRNYWLQIVFSGRGVPPPEFPSDEDVVRYVAREPGAIGYVSHRADTRAVRVLTVK